MGSELEAGHLSLGDRTSEHGVPSCFPALLALEVL